LGKPVVKAKKKQREFTNGLLSAIIAALIIRQFLVQAYTIPTSSMEDTLLRGDFLLVNKFTYGMRTPHWIGIPYTSLGFSVPWFRFPAISDPKPYDVIIFQYPKGPEIDYIKRCIAGGGQELEIKDKVVTVDGTPFPKPPKMKFKDPQIFQRNQGRFLGYSNTFRNLGTRDNYGPLIIPENTYWAMGDNRDDSSDSRFWGPVPQDNIVGKGLIIYFAWNYDVPMSKFYKKISFERIGWVIR
jgi:signal peptidase I